VPFFLFIGEACLWCSLSFGVLRLGEADGKKRHGSKLGISVSSPCPLSQSLYQCTNMFTFHALHQCTAVRQVSSKIPSNYISSAHCWRRGMIVQ